MDMNFRSVACSEAAKIAVVAGELSPQIVPQNGNPQCHHAYRYGPDDQFDGLAGVQEHVTGR
ncbi:hypothetical protein [Rhizobium leguminosarum]|uniref:hypothetical protein n=1 Tax=Rhizobium leguminosarum TaxID=384 RepID=UPI0014412134|nr:hypothetical protein [Rhizobium leguminosarum]MBY5867088.1 hypothetical protein [Rhizobium leguminosarum]